MNVEILKENDSVVLKRKNYILKVSWNGPLPSRKEIKDKLVAMKNTKPELTVITHIHTSFGKHSALVYAAVYNDEKTMKKLETKRVLEKNSLIEVKK